MVVEGVALSLKQLLRINICAGYVVVESLKEVYASYGFGRVVVYVILNEGIKVVGSGLGNCLAVYCSNCGNNDVRAEVINLHTVNGCLAALDNESLGVACIGNGDSTIESLSYGKYECGSRAKVYGCLGDYSAECKVLDSLSVGCSAIPSPLASA